LNLHYTHIAAEIPFNWDAYVSNNANLKLNQLAVFEAAQVQDIKPIYIWLTDKDVIVGVLYAQVFRFKPKYVNTQNMNTFACFISKVSLGLLPVSILTIGNLFRHDGSYFLFNHPTLDNKSVMEFAITALQQKVRCNALFLKDFDEALSQPYANNKRYNRFSNDVSMELRIPNSWLTFDDYAAALKHKYKQRLTKMQKSFTDIIVKKLTTQEVVDQQQDIFNLYNQVTSNQTISLGKLNATYFAEFKKSMGDSLHVYGFYYQNKLVAFSSAIVKDGAYDMNYIGFDYQYNSQFNLYFNMLFFFVDCAIKEQCHHLVLGRTALEAKAIIGCTPKNIYGYYTINNKLFYNLTQWVTKRLANNQGELWQQRHPFKSDYYEQPI
jgi:hypothetical protein